MVEAELIGHVIRWYRKEQHMSQEVLSGFCLLYTSDAADDLLCVDLGGRRIQKKKKKKNRV